MIKMADNFYKKNVYGGGYNSNYGSVPNWVAQMTANAALGRNNTVPATPAPVQQPTANYQFSFERPNNNGGSNWQDIFFNRNHYNPATSTNSNNS